jgi:hypothetical protein
MSTELSAAVLGIDEDDAEERNRGTGLRERRLARRERMATDCKAGDLDETKTSGRNREAQESINLKEFNLCSSGQDCFALKRYSPARCWIEDRADRKQP